MTEFLEVLDPAGGKRIVGRAWIQQVVCDPLLLSDYPQGTGCVLYMSGYVLGVRNSYSDMVKWLIGRI